LTIDHCVQHLPLKLSIFLIADYWYLFDLTLAVSFSVKLPMTLCELTTFGALINIAIVISICRGLLY